MSIVINLKSSWVWIIHIRLTFIESKKHCPYNSVYRMMTCLACRKQEDNIGMFKVELVYIADTKPSKSESVSWGCQDKESKVMQVRSILEVYENYAIWVNEYGLFGFESAHMGHQPYTHMSRWWWTSWGWGALEWIGFFSNFLIFSHVINRTP